MADKLRGQSMIVGSLTIVELTHFKMGASMMVGSFRLELKDLICATPMGLSIMDGSNAFLPKDLICLKRMISSMIVGSSKVEVRDLVASLWTTGAVCALEMTVTVLRRIAGDMISH
eukprot:CAMPEP_0197737244 /NCGR_PEP_ID=MMETSP1435-20131217/8201_1 /TAXON_ID=426625 /ORGANISM="Chaetoceros brevis, Strain CCMP164" /LENGTH=115 /DNA_ID=CAMNT_0043325711 /DNA_START=117 /DNA_END=464 /DNA_ORIENTATION=-